jgi:hypothetical protein
LVDDSICLTYFNLRDDSPANARGAGMRDDADYLNSTKLLWEEQGNPIWVWLAIKTSIQNEHPVPQWVCEYLEKIADHFLSDHPRIGDFSRKLPSILGFQTKRGPKHPLKIFKRMRKNEQFAMKFAKHILAGNKPSTARKDAANECGKDWRDVDDKVLQATLREHFKLKRLPASTIDWQRIVLQWLFDNPHSYKRYPDLPRITNRLAELAAISRNCAVTN